ncbi:carboxynorspermidine decarboxylase [Agaribacterium haliotis]|uniref:carboxynorspermidine decarboxylase n=1 Tax=Agaribacterium haliotis TaxID=2013869 RepID=UPI000BB5550B|nr:carboxynorspermidine decarboxylase [Agaribacterium haliotis]
MIKSTTFYNFDTSRVPSPCFVIDEVVIENNLKILNRVQQESGAKVLAALKAFSCWSLAPLYKNYLSGVCASGLHEAMLGHEHYGGEVHTYSAAYKHEDLDKLCEISEHLIFNSFAQWQRFQPLLKQKAQQGFKPSFGLRINPEHSEGEVALYDPCAPCSRLGIPRAQFEGQDLSGISGLHFHSLCEQLFEPLERTLDSIEHNFADILPRMQWLNFGGGHWITAPGYDIDKLIRRIKDFSEKYRVQVYLEPGEAVAIHSGVLVTEVLDLPVNNRPLAIVDCSATCHMPDTLEMPYRADVFDAGEHGEKPFNYRLGSTSCLAGDVLGDYSFDKELKIGQRLMFDDQSHYTMVKTSTFNGIKLPAIALWNSETDQLKIVKEFSYSDFLNRLS